ncbi:MAG: hypothetical protein IJ661_03175 [Lachnospiraceae bacterium]|nr:hypothetical protein [Lachnospiraceae bacterium]
MRKIYNRRCMSAVSAFIMALTMAVVTMGSGITAKAAETGVSSPRIADDGTVTWDKVAFGSYYQEMNEPEPQQIKWRILAVNGDDALLLADKALDCKTYNEENKAVTWETCSLRKWLNGIDDSYNYSADADAFINTAFDDSERAAINETEVINDDNTDYGISGGNDTRDKVFLLSYDEALKAEYGFEESASYSKTRSAKATEYACVKGASYDSDNNTDWWLRSPGISGNTAKAVHHNGFVSIGTVGIDDYGIRPALHIKLSAVCVTDAGTVNSTGETTPEDNDKPKSSYKAPSKSGDVTTWDCVYFGKYAQKLEFEKKPIEWRVLSVDGDDALLLADKALDCKTYNEENKAVTWETCSLRKWLNGIDDSYNYSTDADAFINIAFDDSERTVINETEIPNNGNTDYNVAASSATADKIFLLSLDEIIRDDYGFAEDIMKRSVTRQAKVTDYTYMNNGMVSKTYPENEVWWLRSPGASLKTAAHVSFGGDGESAGGYVYFNYGVRPALHISLSKALELDSFKILDPVSMREQTEAERWAAAAAKVDKLIEAIGPVTLDSKDKIEAAREAYDGLADGAKNKVTKYDDLTAAEAKLAELVKQEKDDSEAAAKVDKLISDIGEVTLNSRNKIEAAREEYNTLTSGAKSKVTQYDKLLAAEARLNGLLKQEKQEKDDSEAAAKVDELIGAIGDVTLDSKDKIEAARAAYNALSSGAKAKVTKYAVVQAAETKLAELETAAAEEAKEEAANAVMVKTTPAMAAVKAEKTKKGKASVTIKWKKVKGANGYKVYRSTKKNKGYKCVKTIKKAATKSWKDTGVKTGKTYYYKMRAYKKSGKKTIYSKYSSTKKIRVK